MAERVSRLSHRTPGRSATGTVLGVVALAGIACGDEDPEPGGDIPQGECVGESTGDATVSASYPTPLPGGGRAGIGSVDTDADPHLLNIVLGGDATQDERDRRYLSVGGSFTVRQTTYTVAGFCADKAWLNQRRG